MEQRPFGPMTFRTNDPSDQGPALLDVSYRFRQYSPMFLIVVFLIKKSMSHAHHYLDVLLYLP